MTHSQKQTPAVTSKNTQDPMPAAAGSNFREHEPGTGRRRFRGDPLTNPTARGWAIRDYRLYLLREATQKRSVRSSNNALAALDDFVRLGLGKANVGRDELPKTAPKAMDADAEIRWLRGVEAWPRTRDRALALLPRYAGLRIGDVVVLDVDDVRISARKGNLPPRSARAARSVRSPSTRPGHTAAGMAG